MMCRRVVGPISVSELSGEPCHSLATGDWDASSRSSCASLRRRPVGGSVGVPCMLKIVVSCENYGVVCPLRLRGRRPFLGTGIIQLMVVNC